MESATKDILEATTEITVQSLYRSAFLPKPYPIEDSRALQLKIFSMANDDKDILKFIDSEIDRMEKGCVTELENIRSWKQLLKS